MNVEKPAPRCTFRYSERLHSQKDFQRLIKKGRRLVHPALLIYSGPNALDNGLNRLGLITSRKLGTAVKRNRLKRRLREIFRLNKYLIKSGTDLVFQPKLPAMKLNYAELESIVLAQLTKIGMFTP